MCKIYFLGKYAFIVVLLLISVKIFIHLNYNFLERTSLKENHVEIQINIRLRY